MKIIVFKIYIKKKGYTGIVPEVAWFFLTFKERGGGDPSWKS